MARGGKKYPLIVYQHMLNRWWSPMIAIGLALFGLAYVKSLEPIAKLIPWRWQLFAVIGAMAILVGVFFLIIRQLAYVQTFPGYLKLVTPFMQINISYKRINKTTASEMRQLFEFKKMSGWVQEIFSPLATRTALVINLKSYPISPIILRLSLSRFFFKDKTPHLVILVNDWMQLSAELDSMRSGEGPKSDPPQKRQKNSILTRLPQK